MSQSLDIDHAEAAPNGKPNLLKARRLGIETLHEIHVFLHQDCAVSRSEGFWGHTRILVSYKDKSVIANMYQITSDIIGCDEIGFSGSAWRRLGLEEGAEVAVSHPPPLNSLGNVRGKVFGLKLDSAAMNAVIGDIEKGLYSNIQLSAFITACAAGPLDHDEMCALTRAMVEVGERIDWHTRPIVDKHSVGGLLGNRTTPIVVAVVAACGLIIPKTSSRAITSPAGTADAMETLAPVDLDVPAMRRVVEREGGCVVWGGAVRLSPTDDILIRVERVLDLDGEGQLVASILSKKIAAGATHLVLDIPVGPTAKVRTAAAAEILSRSLIDVGRDFGVIAKTILSDGRQPVGRGFGPALEARDVLAVLQGMPDAPRDLRARALVLAAALLELGGAAREGQGAALAETTLASGRAWTKFQRICDAQGGMRIPPVSTHRHIIAANRAGTVAFIDNRLLSRVAKLAGAPEDKAAGLELHVRLGDQTRTGQPLYTIHAESEGELNYALRFARANPNIIQLDGA